MADMSPSAVLTANIAANGDYLFEFEEFLNWLPQLPKLDTEICEKTPPPSKPLFVFVSKKGYWIYRLAELQLRKSGRPSLWKDALDSGEIEVKSDRYFTKIVSYQDAIKQLQGRFIYVIDDFLIMGQNILRFCSLIRGWAKGSRIIPVVFAQWEGFQPGGHKEFSHMRVYSRNSQTVPPTYPMREIGKLSIWENAQFHKFGIPYVIDLPFLKFANSGASRQTFFSGTLPLANFKELREHDNPLWECVDTSYSIGSYSAKTCFFCFQHDIFLDKFRFLIQNLVMECIYQENGDQVSVTFTPFAVLRSVRQDELLCRFHLAFSDTEYERLIQDYTKNPESKREDVNFNTALYRALVFFFSRYISVNFKNYLEDIFGVELQLNVEELRHHWPKEFESSLSQIFGNGFHDRLRRIYEKNDITPYRPESQRRLICKSSNMYYNIFSYFAFQKMARKQGGDFCTIEELETVIAQHSERSIDAPDFRQEFTSAIYQLLSQGVISNQVRFDAERHIVLRGFRSGENSTLLLPFNQKAVFKAIYVYYLMCQGELSHTSQQTDSSENQFYYDHYPMFQTKLLKFIQDSELDGYLDIQEAEDTLNYFRAIEPGALREQIENKTYIIKDLENDTTRTGTLAKMLAEYVLCIDFQ